MWAHRWAVVALAAALVVGCDDDDAATSDELEAATPGPLAGNADTSADTAPTVSGASDPDSWNFDVTQQQIYHYCQTDMFGELLEDLIDVDLQDMDPTYPAGVGDIISTPISPDCGRFIDDVGSRVVLTLFSGESGDDNDDDDDEIVPAGVEVRREGNRTYTSDQAPRGAGAAEVLLRYVKLDTDDGAAFVEIYYDTESPLGYTEAELIEIIDIVVDSAGMFLDDAAAVEPVTGVCSNETISDDLGRMAWVIDHACDGEWALVYAETAEMQATLGVGAYTDLAITLQDGVWVVHGWIPRGTCRAAVAASDIPDAYLDKLLYWQC